MERPKITDMNKLRLSPSSINSFYYCPKKWYKIYVERLQQGDSKDTLRGKAVHTACEKIFDDDVINAIPNDLSEATTYLKNKIQEIFSNEWNAYEEKFKEIELSMDDKNNMFSASSYSLQVFIDRKINEAMVHLDKDKVKRFKTAYKRIKPKFKELWVEDKKLNVGGFIDSVQYDSYSDDITLIDYKTSLRKGEVMTIDYRRQLSIYALLFYKTKKKMPKYVGINYLLDGNTILLEVTPELLKFAEDVVAEVREKIVTWGFDENKYSDVCRFKRDDGKWIEYKWKGDL